MRAAGQPSVREISPRPGRARDKTFKRLPSEGRGAFLRLRSTICLSRRDLLSHPRAPDISTRAQPCVQPALASRAQHYPGELLADNRLPREIVRGRLEIIVFYKMQLLNWYCILRSI